MRDAKRKAHGLAFANAMKEIKNQMLSDSAAITSELEKVQSKMS